MFKPGNQLSPAAQARAKEEQDRQLAVRMAEEHSVREFAAELSRAVGTFLACTPYSQWPSFCKAAFEHAKIKAPTSAYLYRERLPKD